MISTYFDLQFTSKSQNPNDSSLGIDDKKKEPF